MDDIRHGGDIYRHAVELDFSVNENPFGMPEGVRQALTDAVAQCRHYPDPQAQELTEALARRCGILRENILFGNGASELFMAIVHALQPRRALLPVPSFAGYEHVLEAVRSEVRYYPLREETQFCLDAGILAELKDVELLFLAQPNNPVGNLMDRAFLEKLLDACMEKGIYVVLDECFLELCPEGERASFVRDIERYPKLMVVRAFTKTYGIPGVRLGYLVCEKELLALVRRQLPEWNVSVPAQAAGMAALREDAYLTTCVAQLQMLRQTLCEQLRELGLTVYEGSGNFILCKSDLPLYEALLQRKILIRDCANYKGLERGYYRIAVRRPEENGRLLQAIRKIREEMGSAPTCQGENG